MGIRILHVLGGLGRGGAESMVMNLYRHIDRKTIQFDFVIYEDGKSDFCNEIEALGGRIFKSPHYRGANTVEYIKFWRQFLSEHEEFAIIHGHVRSTAFIYLYIAGKMNRKTIAHSHSTSNGTGLSGYAKSIMQIPVRWLSDYQIACSYEAGVWLFGKNAAKKNSFLILKNAIDICEFQFKESTRTKTRKELRLEDKFVICNVGRLTYPKNHKFIIKIFKKVSEKSPKAALLLVGEGELEKKLADEVKKNKLDEKVYFLGARSDIPDILCASDVFLFPSLYEGLGIAAVEAQAAGLMCICSDNLPKEVFLTPYIKKLNLAAGERKWADTLLKYENKYKRISNTEVLIDAGYSIEETVKKVEQLYLGIH